MGGNAMKKFVIAVLICLNLALVATLAFHASPGEAQALRRGRGGNYSVITGRMNTNLDVVYVIDPDNQLLMGWVYDKATRTGMNALKPRDLERDFPQ